MRASFSALSPTKSIAMADCVVFALLHDSGKAVFVRSSTPSRLTLPIASKPSSASGAGGVTGAGAAAIAAS
jgi:hypothetical protein